MNPNFVLRVLFILGLILPAGNVMAWSQDRYHSLQDIENRLLELSNRYPRMARFQSLGKSAQGRQLGLLFISKSNDPNAPVIYFNGAHHGNEKVTAEVVVALAEHLLRNNNRLRLDHILRSYRIALQPVVNPDGFVANTRFNAQGIDINRDYSPPGKADRFETPESRAVRDFLKSEKVLAAAALHSGQEAIFWPWCDSPEASRHDTQFQQLARAVAGEMATKRVTQSYFDYKTDGEFIDFAYANSGTYALTFEIAKQINPEQHSLPALLKRSIDGLTFFLYTADDILKAPQRMHVATEDAYPW